MEGSKNVHNRRGCLLSIPEQISHLFETRVETSVYSENGQPIVTPWACCVEELEIIDAIVICTQYEMPDLDLGIQWLITHSE